MAMDTDTIPTLIYCGGGNRRFYEIATAAGFEYGAQLPDTVYGPLYFADQDWKRPNRQAYMASLDYHRPAMATVLDWEHEDQLDKVLSWAEEAAQLVRSDVVIIPKVVGGLPCLPRDIGGKRVVLGYSVPTKYGGTPLPLWEFAGWPIHLLGGSPQDQIQTWLHLRGIAQIVSTDGNMIQKMATQHCQFWVSQTAYYARNRHWPTIREADRQTWNGSHDAPYEAFKRSCHNIIAAWKQMQEPGEST